MSIFCNNFVISVFFLSFTVFLISSGRKEHEEDFNLSCPLIGATKGLQSKREVLELLESNEMKNEKSSVMCVLNQRNGNVIFSQKFPLYEFWGVWLDLKRHLENVAPERIVILSCSGESVTGLRNVTQMMSSLGSTMVDYLDTDSVWVWAFVNGGKTLFEKINPKLYVNNNQTAFSHILFGLSNITIVNNNNKTMDKRWEFCSKYGVTGDLCDESSILPFDAFPQNATNTILNSIPVIITAGNRTSYLYQSLKSYLMSFGSLKNNFHVLLGSNSSQTVELLSLLNISYTFIPPSQYGDKVFFPFLYYKEVFNYVVSYFNDSLYAIFLEEDVEVSRDFFTFMNQTIRLLNEDPSLYCISGYSSTGLKDLSYNETVLLRGDVPVGWGYALSLKFIKDALNAWPTYITERKMVYDGWIYLNLKGKRECVFPEVSRVRHFGVGLNTIYWLSEKIYFTMPLAVSHSVSLTNVRDLILPVWVDQLKNKIKGSLPVEENVCNKNFIARHTKEAYILCYNYTMNDYQSALANFATLGNCFKMWVYSFQGQHDYVSIIRISPTTIIYFVAHPMSSYSDLCPKKYAPFDIRNLNSEEISIFDHNVNVQSKPYVVHNELNHNRLEDLSHHLFDHS